MSLLVTGNKIYLTILYEITNNDYYLRMRKLEESEVIRRFKALNGDKYDYSKIKFINIITI